MNLAARLALIISLLDAFATWRFFGDRCCVRSQIWAAFIMRGLSIIVEAAFQVSMRPWLVASGER
jgi:hypothetical protein